MKVEDYFNKKKESDWVYPNPESDEDINRKFLTQLCYDGQMADEEIDEFVGAIIEWKNKQAKSYHESEISSINEQVNEIKRDKFHRSVGGSMEYYRAKVYKYEQLLKQ